MSYQVAEQFLPEFQVLDPLCLPLDEVQTTDR